MANSFLNRIVTRLGGSTINEMVEKRVKEEINKVNSGDVLRFSPSGAGFPKEDALSKPLPLGISQQTLRDFADVYPIVRSAIEFRKSQITHLDWTISPIEITDESVQDKKNIENIKKIKDFLRYPTGKKDSSFTNWIKQILEDLLVLDNIAIYRKKSRKGDIIGYLPVDATTIYVRVEDDGTLPDPPDYAYIQKIKGQEKARLTVDELIFASMNPRTHSAYGFSPLESLIITVTTALKLQSFNLAYLCYDEETEILTKSGWKYFGNLTKDDIVATRNSHGKFEWQKPSKRVNFNYKDKLVRFKSNTVDLFVTPNHRMLVDYRGSYGKFTELNLIKRADWFIQNPKSLTQNYLAPTTSKWNGISPKYFELPEYMVVREGKFSGYAFKGKDKNNIPIRDTKKFITEKKTITYKKDKVRIDIKDWVSFLGLYLAEGWVRTENNQSRHDIYIAQSKESKYWKEIKNLLEKLPFNFSWQEKRQLFECSDARLWNYLKQFGHSYDKFIPEEVKDYSSELLEIFWEWGLKGDGTLTKDNTWVYSTVSKKLADDWQEILQKIGKEGRISVHYQQVGKIIKGKKAPIKTTLPIYKVFERTSAHRSLSCASEEYYEGKVYSVKVPNGIVYIRRNGIPLWCGNTEGNVPEGFVTLPRDIASSRDQLKEWQDAWDSMLAGDPRLQRKLKFLPEGMSYEATKKPEDMTFERFEKWLLQVTCSVYGLHPSAIGFNFDVNRATAQITWEAGRERGLFPTALFLKEIMDRIVQIDLEHPELQFVWTNIDPTNRSEEAKVVQTLINSGLMAIDEWRLGEGLKPTGIKDPFLMTPVGPIFVKDLLAQSESGQEPVAPYKPRGTSSSQDIRNLPIPSQARAKMDTEFVDELRKWKKVSINDFKNNKPVREFKTDILDKRTYNLIKKGLSVAKNRKAIQEVFKPFLKKDYLVSRSLLKFYDNIDENIKQKYSATEAD